MAPRDIEFGRLITAMVTPFDKSGAVDYAQAARLAKSLVENGTDSIVVSGTTGESPTLTNGEKIRLFATVREAIAGRGKVIGGTCNYSTHESIEFTREAAGMIDGVLAVVPYYNNPPQEGLYRHFRAIAESTDLPCVVYNVPSRTVRNMEAATTIRLAQDVPNIVGVKEAVDSTQQVAEIIEGVPSDFRVWSGNDQDTFTTVCLGGYGVVSVASHVVGNQIKRMIDLTVQGNIKEAARLHRHLLPLAKALFPPIAPVASPASIKAALNVSGFDVGGLRLPLIEIPENYQNRLKDVLGSFELDRLPTPATA
ncbi:MAG TPA: 4-hydroxy-tetrahydrodipicolinate synthase [Chloroflexota bacterium]|nr:4-hydroxy-tetrahydrodipicolinate synthase [Chloroflexota bacterium]